MSKGSAPSRRKGKAASHTHTLRPYDQLLSPVRLRLSSRERGSVGLEALSDKSRIIGSPAFHRLQSKAQVFSLARSGAVRTRLTHSIEVSNYGELIAESIAEELVKRGTILPENRLPFVQTVENACLLHDIGNPPFGHMGEYAIREWFRDNAKGLRRAWSPSLSQEEADFHLSKLEHFDGNPQGLRIIARLQWFHDEHGMNLTCPLIAAYMKYIGGDVQDTVHFRKKLGFFPSEAEVVKEVWKRLDLRRDKNGLPGQRHPLAYIMEAADDIAYCFSDIEDALERRVVSEEHVLETLAIDLKESVAKAKADAAKLNAPASSNPTYHALRLTLSAELVKSATDTYLAAHKAILEGTLQKPLLSTNEGSKKILAVIKGYSREWIYSHRDVVDMELGGLRAVTGMLDRYCPLLMLAPSAFSDVRDKSSSQRFKDHPVEVLLYELLPKKQLKVYDWQTEQNAQNEPVFRTQLVVDYISGMTDSHAIKVYNIMNGTQPFGIE